MHRYRVAFGSISFRSFFAFAKHCFVGNFCFRFSYYSLHATHTHAFWFSLRVFAYEIFFLWLVLLVDCSLLFRLFLLESIFSTFLTFVLCGTQDEQKYYDKMIKIMAVNHVYRYSYIFFLVSFFFGTFLVVFMF